MEKKRPVAAFDIDGTLFRSSLLIELVERLIDHDVFPRESREIYAAEHAQWLDRKGDYDSYVRKVIEVSSTQLKGISYSVVADIGGEIIEEMKDRVYRYTRDLVQELKKKVTICLRFLILQNSWLTDSAMSSVSINLTVFFTKQARQITSLVKSLTLSSL